MAQVSIAPASAVHAEVHLPGDRSLARATLAVALLGRRTVRIDHVPRCADIDAACAAIEQLGARVEVVDAGTGSARSLLVTGAGLAGADGPATLPAHLDLHAAGAASHLAVAVAAATTLPRPASDGAISLAGVHPRALRTLVESLARAGAAIAPAADIPGTLTIVPTGNRLRAVEHDLQVADERLHEALLVSGVLADGPTTLREPAKVRDHADRALRRAGIRIARASETVTVHTASAVELPDSTLAGDTTIAATLACAATLLHGSLLRLPGVLLNPTRMAFFELLEGMGALIGYSSRRTVDGEQVGDLEVQHGNLSRVAVLWNQVPEMIDELPVLALISHFCRGETVVKGLSRVADDEHAMVPTMVRALRDIGVNIEQIDDGFVVRGPGMRVEGGTLDAAGDPRIAMLGGLAGLVSRRGVTVDGAECVARAFPGYFELLDRIAVR